MSWDIIDSTVAVQEDLIISSSMPLLHVVSILERLRVQM